MPGSGLLPVEAAEVVRPNAGSLIRLQRGRRHPGLEIPIDDHGNAEQTTVAARFRRYNPI
jgi:hypothetical protein